MQRSGISVHKLSQKTNDKIGKNVKRKTQGQSKQKAWVDSLY